MIPYWPIVIAPSHEYAVHDVLWRLKNTTYLKPEKCVGRRSSVDSGGNSLKRGVTAWTRKISGIADWPIPKTVKDVRPSWASAISIAPFIRGFGKHARPLNQLTRKDVEWTWDTKEHKHSRPQTTGKRRTVRNNGN